MVRKSSYIWYTCKKKFSLDIQISSKNSLILGKAVVKEKHILSVSSLQEMLGTDWQDMLKTMWYIAC